MENYTEILADFAGKKKFQDLPQEVINQTKRLILDTLGCALAGSQTEMSKASLNLIKNLEGKPESSLFGYKFRTSSPQAAYVNAKSANALDFDDCLYNESHPSPSLVMTALSVGEAFKSSGEEIITAVALGYEIGARIGYSALASQSLFRPFFSPLRTIKLLVETVREKSIFSAIKKVTPLFALGYISFSWEVFGPAVATAKLLSMNKPQVINAFGIAGHYAPLPTMGKYVEGPETMLKYADSGWIAMGGILSADLAREGHTGYPSILDGENAFFKIINPKARKCSQEIIIGNLGNEWHILNGSAFKPYPCCRHIHYPIEITKKLMRENQIKVEEIEEIIVRGIPIFIIAPIYANQGPFSHPVDAQHSVPYNIAMAVLDVPILEWQSHKYLNDTLVKEIMGKVSVRSEPKGYLKFARQWPFIKSNPSSVTIKARGKKFKGRIEFAKGDPWSEETKMSDEELKEKFLKNAQVVLSEEKSRKICEKIFNLERIKDINEITKLFV